MAVSPTDGVVGLITVDTVPKRRRTWVIVTTGAWRRLRVYSIRKLNQAMRLAAHAGLPVRADSFYQHVVGAFSFLAALDGQAEHAGTPGNPSVARWSVHDAVDAEGR
jgi:hypothetical protein